MRMKALALPLAAAALLAGCSGGGDKVAATGSPSPSPTASPTPSPTPAVVGDPLTGLALVRGPVVAVKVDNASLARPPTTPPPAVAPSPGPSGERADWWWYQPFQPQPPPTN